MLVSANAISRLVQMRVEYYYAAKGRTLFRDKRRF